MTFERFLGSYKLSILIFVQANRIAALWFSRDMASCCEATLYMVSCLGLAIANQNGALRFCIPLYSNEQPECDQLHNIAVKSRVCTTKKPFQCHQTFPHAGIRGWEQHYIITCIWASGLCLIEIIVLCMTQALSTRRWTAKNTEKSQLLALPPCFERRVNKFWVMLIDPLLKVYDNQAVNQILMNSTNIVFMVHPSSTLA